MLYANPIVDEGLLLLEHTRGKPAQVGYDLSLKTVQKIGNKIGGGAYNLPNGGKIGKVLKNKTELTTYTPIDSINLDGDAGWLLYEGVYDINFNE